MWLGVHGGELEKGDRNRCEHKPFYTLEFSKTKKKLTRKKNFAVIKVF